MFEPEAGHEKIGGPWFRLALFVTMALCFFPLLLASIGVDLSSGCALPSQSVAPADFSETAFHALRGSFTHTLLEWTAVCAATIVCAICLFQYRLTREPSLPVIGVALACAGAMDAFHTLAADRLLQSVADPLDLIPFTWALCRLFNGMILLLGVGVCSYSSMRKMKTEQSVALVALICFVFIGAAYAVIHWCAISSSLPKTMFPENMIKRPFDLVPLLPYLACGLFVFPRYLKRTPTAFAYALLLSIPIHVATQLYMAFGSDTLHDNYFNVAHALKAISYMIPCLGIVMEYEQAHRKQCRTELNLKSYSAELEATHEVLELQTKELAERADQLVESRLRSEQANQAKSEFLANMSHEIRTPMTAILGYTEVLVEDLEKPENIEAAKIIKRNGTYLLEIINDILDLSKIEAEKMELENVRFSLPQLLADIISLMSVRAQAKNIGLKLVCQSPLPETIQSDPTRVRQILINLLGNAIKFTPSGEVQLSVCLTEDRETDPQLLLRVTDTGIGMSEEQLAKIFQPFTQADNSTTRQFGGTGLGLAISKRLANLIGGDICVESRLGRGSIFTLAISPGDLTGIPRKTYSEATLLEEIEKTPTEKVERKTDQPLLGCEILLAEDGLDNQRLISLILRKTGALVTVAENGQIAVDEALKRESGFDVILMDMQMPIMDGQTAVRLLREKGYEKPIIALTAHAMASDRAKCLDSGCDDYATKPVDRESLINLVWHYATQPISFSGSGI